MNRIEEVEKRLLYLQKYENVPAWEKTVLSDIVKDVGALVEREIAREKIEQREHMNRTGYDGMIPIKTWFYYKRIVVEDPYSEDENEIRYNKHAIVYAVSKRPVQKWTEDSDFITFDSLGVKIRIKKIMTTDELSWVANHLEGFGGHFVDLTDECTRLAHIRWGVKLELPMSTMMLDNDEYNETPTAAIFDDWYGELEAEN